MIQIDDIVRVVKEASALMRLDGVVVMEKGGCENIVTSADRAVQDYLCDRLAQLLPGSGFICEEDDVCDATHAYTWIIDPIDGTANFSRGIDHCAISVGLRHGEAMETAVVYIPATDELFTAERGKGAWRNGQPIHVSDRPFSNALMCTALAVYHKEYAKVCSDIILDAFMECNDVRRLGACTVELCYMAMGRHELYFEYVLSPWDFAAASLILTEAGGAICDLRGEPLDCISPSGVLAANNRENLTHLVEIVGRHI